MKLCMTLGRQLLRHQKMTGCGAHEWCLDQAQIMRRPKCVILLNTDTIPCTERGLASPLLMLSMLLQRSARKRIHAS